MTDSDLDRIYELHLEIEQANQRSAALEAQNDRLKAALRVAVATMREASKGLLTGWTVSETAIEIEEGVLRER